MEMQRRRATVQLNKYWADKRGEREGPMPCHVLGLFQCVEADDCAYPVFVCELLDGSVIEEATNAVIFTDVVKGELI